VDVTAPSLVKAISELPVRQDIDTCLARVSLRIMAITEPTERCKGFEKFIVRPVKVFAHQKEAGTGGCKRSSSRP